MSWKVQKLATVRVKWKEERGFFGGLSGGGGDRIRRWWSGSRLFVYVMYLNLFSVFLCLKLLICVMSLQHLRRKKLYWNNSTRRTLCVIECASSPSPARVRTSHLWRELLWGTARPPAAAARQTSPEPLSASHTQQHPSAHLETPHLTHLSHLKVRLHLSQEEGLADLCLQLTNGRTPWVGRGIQLKKMCKPTVTQRRTAPKGEQPDSRSPRERQTRTWRLSSPLRSRMGAPPPPLHPPTGATSSPSPTWPHALPLMHWGRDQVGASTLLQQEVLK